MDQVGAACHTGARTCFIAGGDLGAVVGERDPQDDGAHGDQQDRDQQDEETR